MGPLLSDSKVAPQRTSGTSIQIDSEKDAGYSKMQTAGHRRNESSGLSDITPEKELFTLDDSTKSSGTQDTTRKEENARMVANAITKTVLKNQNEAPELSSNESLRSPQNHNSGSSQEAPETQGTNNGTNALASDYNEVMGEARGTKQASDPSSEVGDGKTRWKNKLRAGGEDLKFSVSDVKRLVFAQLSESVRMQFSEDTWNQIFDENDSILSADLIPLQHRYYGEEDVSDLVSCISGKIQDHCKRTRSKSLIDKRSNGPAPTEVAQPRMSAPPGMIEKAKQASQQGPKASILAGNSSDGPRIPFVVAVSQDESEGGNQERRGVKFSQVDIRFYETILSDNPSVSHGPPVGIGWRYKKMKKGMSVDDFEAKRLPFRRFTADELVLSYDARTTILAEAGFTQKELAGAVRGILRIKNQRTQTYHNLRYQRMEEMMEKTTRRFKRALTLGLVDREKKKTKKKFENFEKQKQKYQQQRGNSALVA